MNKKTICAAFSILFLSTPLLCSNPPRRINQKMRATQEYLNAQNPQTRQHHRNELRNLGWSDEQIDLLTRRRIIRR